MRKRFRQYIRRLYKGRIVLLAVGIVSIMAACTVMAVRTRSQSSERCLVASVQTNASCRRSLAKSLLESSQQPDTRTDRTVSRVNRVLSRALRFASSL